MKDYRLVVCASGGGGNFQALVDARQIVGFEITRLIVDRDCGATERAEKAGIPVIHVSRKNLAQELLGALTKDTDLVVLAGFMPIVPAEVCAKWQGRIINTHPSLLPKFGGKGMYGVKVQEAVMAAGEKQAGCSVHFVTNEIDGGEIILQKSIEVDYTESPWQLGGRIFKEENKLLVEAVKLLRERAKTRGPS